VEVVVWLERRPERSGELESWVDGLGLALRRSLRVDRRLRLRARPIASRQVDLSSSRSADRARLVGLTTTRRSDCHEVISANGRELDPGGGGASKPSKR
jgi:hypothetical protein